MSFGFLLLVGAAFNAEIVGFGVAALLVGVTFLWWGNKGVSTRPRDGEMAPSPGGRPGMSARDRSWQWLWATPAVLSICSLIVNVRNPHLTPGSRLVWWFVMLPLIMIMVGYGLYGDYCQRRSRRPHGVVTAIILGLCGLAVGVIVWSSFW